MYCGECLGYTSAIAKAAQDFTVILDKYQFEKTAESVFSKQLADYDKLIDMVDFMSGLSCKATCREVDGGESECIVRQCAVDRGYSACNECEGFEECEKRIVLLGSLHMEACNNNLKAINKMGLIEWLENGKKHHYWDRD
jgi:hypothetical protein